MILISWAISFENSSRFDEIETYRRNLKLDIFTCMEASSQPWVFIQMMPVKIFYDYLKWKTEIEEEKRKRVEEKFKK